jgi:hypothetical protein
MLVLDKALVRCRCRPGHRSPSPSQLTNIHPRSHLHVEFRKIASGALRQYALVSPLSTWYERGRKRGAKQVRGAAGSCCRQESESPACCVILQRDGMAGVFSGDGCDASDGAGRFGVSSCGALDDTCLMDTICWTRVG